MKYQRARLLDNCEVASIRGALLWVEARRPEMQAATGRWGTGYVLPELRYYSHLRLKGRPMLVPAAVVELLPEFSEDVPTLEHAEWLATLDKNA
ncbi:MAG: hypothetical protein ACYDCQ_22825 [Dehalococcoidia bacterium]